MSVERFHIHVEQHALDDLKRRLQSTRFTRFTGSGGWDHGTSPEYLQELVEHWHTRYDWRHQEVQLNTMPHYKARLPEGTVHFVHARGQGSNAMPLLLLHGWPDSFYRYYKVIAPLSNPAAFRRNPLDAFDVVVPSLPGFGFTGRMKFASSAEPVRQTATLLWQLMTDTLGYERFAVAGGDVGTSIAQTMAIDHPDSVVGIHLTDLGSTVLNLAPETLTQPEQKYLARIGKQELADGAYNMVQATKPLSLAPALTDSPAALASWIADRFHSWADHNGNIYRSFTQDEMLTNIMIYWVTNTIATSVFSYFGKAQSPSLQQYDYVTVPVGMALFPKDIGGTPPRALAQRFMNVQRWTEMPHGGHFAPLEVPELYATDIAEFFRGLRTVDADPASAIKAAR